MLLCIDIGNSNITLGLFSGGELLHTFRLQSRREQTADEYAILLRQALELQVPAPARVEHAIIASVVPPLSGTLARAVERGFGCRPLLVSASSDTGVIVAVER